MKLSPVDFVIQSIEENHGMWRQTDYTLNYQGDQEIRIWTANMPIFNTGFYVPNRKISFIEQIKLYRAIRRWHKNAPILKFSDLDLKESDNA